MYLQAHNHVRYFSLGGHTPVAFPSHVPRTFSLYRGFDRRIFKTSMIDVPVRTHVPQSAVALALVTLSLHKQRKKGCVGGNDLQEDRSAVK